MRLRSLLRRIGRELFGKSLPPSTPEYVYAYSAHGRLLRTSRYTGEVEVEDGMHWRPYQGARPLFVPGPPTVRPSLVPFYVAGVLLLLALGAYFSRYEYRTAQDGVRERTNRFTGETCTLWQGGRDQWVCDPPPTPVAAPSR